MSNHDDILALLAANPGLTSRQISERLPAIRWCNVRRMIPKMVRDGYIRRERGTDRYNSLRCYVQAIERQEL
jgi:DNA-binding MarR family transcriptional regulator